VPTFWRTWFLGDTAGALVVVPLVLTWLRDPGAAVRRILTFEGVAMITSVLLLGSIAVRSEAPVLYLIFPAVIWAAFRFGPAGVSLALAINAFVTIGITAERVGVFFRQPIDDRTLGTQLYILVSVLTGLFLSTIFAERERSALDLAESRRREGEKAIEERRRIARDLHDSVSQALFSSLLHSRAAEKALDEQSDRGDASLRRSLASISELTRRAQREMRTFIFEWGPGVVGNDLVPAFSRHASALGESSVVVSVRGPEETLPLSRATQTQLYGIGREALSNVVKHSGATAASVRVQTSPTHVLLEIEDNGRGFDPAIRRPGHYGLESMRSRAEEVGATLEIDSAEGGGTTLRVRVPVQSPVEADAERV